MVQVPNAGRTWIKPRHLRYLRRAGVGISLAAAIFSFAMADLARNDAIFTTALKIMSANTPPIAEFALTNASDTAMTGADINFALYDADGRRIEARDTEGNWGTSESGQFAPRRMTIGENATKFGPLPADELSASLDQIQIAWVCASFDGSFWIDRVRTEYQLNRTAAGGFGQTEHRKTVHFFTEPDCTPPDTLSP